MLRREIKNYFDIEADRYGGRTITRFRDIPKTLKKFVGEKNVLLDIGCGKGEFVNYVDNNLDNFFAVGLDLSKEMLSFRSGKKGKFILGDALYLPFKNDSVDVIYMDTLLHHIIGYSTSTPENSQKKVVDEVIRVIKKDGIFIVQELYYEILFPALSNFLFHFLKLRKKINFPIFTREPLVVIDIKTKKMWLQFFNYFQNQIKLIKWYVIPRTPEFKYKLAGVKEIGNIIIYMEKY